jgi:hypothetical protein
MLRMIPGSSRVLFHFTLALAVLTAWVGCGSSGPAAPSSGSPSSSAEPPLPCKRTVSVSSSAELNAATAGAVAGDCVVLADGSYTFANVNKSGTADNPIVIRAANRGRAIVPSGSLDVRGAYVVVEGLAWTSGGRFSFTDCSSCRLTRCRFQPVESADEVDWINVSGKSDSCRIDHNDVGPRRRIGNDVMLSGSGSQIVQRTRVDHNFFHDVIRSGNDNGWETIRGGLSGWTFSSAGTVIEYNLFRRCDGDPEILSMKSSDNVVRYNTMRGNKGEMVMRHGNRGQVYGNIILGDGVASAGGIRICGGDHRIYDNYVAGVSGAGIFLEGGESDDTTGELTDHKQVYRTQVVFNTVVNDRGIAVGGSHPMDPVDCTIANNLLQGSGSVLTETSSSRNTRYAGNIVNGQTSLARSSAEIRLVDPLLARVGDLFKLAAGSPAVDAADPSFTFVTEDFEGQPRTKPDVGADELSTAPALRGLLSESDVGPDAP